MVAFCATMASKKVRTVQQHILAVLTHTYLTDKIWGSSRESDMASLRVHMAAPRKKIDRYSDIPYVQTHIGIGYGMLKIDE